MNIRTIVINNLGKMLHRSEGTVCVIPDAIISTADAMLIASRPVFFQEDKTPALNNFLLFTVPSNETWIPWNIEVSTDAGGTTITKLFAVYPDGTVYDMVTDSSETYLEAETRHKIALNPSTQVYAFVDALKAVGPEIQTKVEGYRVVGNPSP